MKTGLRRGTGVVWRRVVAGALTVLAMTLLSACGSGSASNGQSSSKPTQGGMLTFAEQPGEPPTYIFPLYDGANSGNNNITYLQPLMWRPLYWVGHTQNALPTVNSAYSLADAPVYSDGDKTITMKLKPYKWSDGTPVTARDLVFWMNLLLAEKTNYSGYVPGGFLDHVASVSSPSPTTFVLKLNRAYSPSYLLYNCLSLLTPIPQHAWDKESIGGPVGNYDMTPAGAEKVYDLLNRESMSLSTWDTDPLWQVVDGPWRLKPKTGFQVTGQTIMVPNRAYSGPDKPRLSEFEELPFTSAEAEFNALQAGQVDYGYIPTTDLAAAGTLKSQGYRIDPFYEWGITFIQLNFSNPKYASLFSQLYIRQAMERLINQPEYIRTILKNDATPTYGPVPSYPRSKFLNPAALKNQYPYSVSAARALLTAHGWQIPASGAATCARPGSGANECGAGIAAGTQLSFPMLYSSGFSSLDDEMQATKSAFGSAGITLGLQQAPEGTVLSDVFECTGKTTASCPSNSTGLSIISSPLYTYVPTYYPDGDALFGCHGAGNGGNYCSPAVDAGIRSVLGAKTGSLATFYKYQLLVAKQLPVLWFPNSAYQISAISPKVGGVTAQDSTAHIYPQTWYVNG